MDFPLERGSSVDLAVLDLAGHPVESPFWVTQGIRCGFTGHVTGLKAGRDEITVTLEPAETEFAVRVRITRVSPGSRADRLGLQAGDVIVSLSETAIDTLSALPRAMEAARAAGRETVELTVERAGEGFEVEVVPGVLGVSLEEFEE